MENTTLRERILEAVDSVLMVHEDIDGVDDPQETLDDIIEAVSIELLIYAY